MKVIRPIQDAMLPCMATNLTMDLGLVSYSDLHAVHVTERVQESCESETQPSALACRIETAEVPGLRQYL